MNDQEIVEAARKAAWEYVKAALNPMAPKHEGLIAVEAFIDGARWMRAKIKDENRNLS